MSSYIQDDDQSSIQTLVNPRLRRGLLIVLEGLDRSGKSTQCETLVSTLESHGVPVRLQKFPNRDTSTGAVIDAYLNRRTEADDHAIHLLFSANRWEEHSRIIEDIHRGVTVVVDRYSFSGVAYSAAKNNPNLDVDWAWTCEIGLVNPDLVIFLDVSTEIARTRGGYGEERYENEEMQNRVRERFYEVFERLEGVDVQFLDAGYPWEEVANTIWGLVQTKMWSVNASEERWEEPGLLALKERVSG